MSRAERWKLDPAHLTKDALENNRAEFKEKWGVEVGTANLIFENSQIAEMLDHLYLLYARDLREENDRDAMLRLQGICRILSDLLSIPDEINEIMQDELDSASHRSPE